MDDHQIEEYLRTFRPVRPAALPQHRRQWRFVALATAAALVIGVVILPQFNRAPSRPAMPQPITLGSANNLLVNASSWKEALDDAGFAFRSSPAEVLPFRRSALEFLSQEDLSK